MAGEYVQASSDVRVIKNSSTETSKGGLPRKVRHLRERWGTFKLGCGEDDGENKENDGRGRLKRDRVVATAIACLLTLPTFSRFQLSCTMSQSSRIHHVHPGDLPYATPVLRAASPSGSINTEYGPDETSQSDLDLSPEEFEEKVAMSLGLHEQREHEISAESKSLLLPKPKSAAEEKCRPVHASMIRILCVDPGVLC